MSRELELLLCPACQSRGFIAGQEKDKGVFVMCEKISCMYGSVVKRNVDEAIAAWNALLAI